MSNPEYDIPTLVLQAVNHALVNSPTLKRERITSQEVRDIRSCITHACDLHALGQIDLTEPLSPDAQRNIIQQGKSHRRERAPQIKNNDQKMI